MCYNEIKSNQKQNKNHQTIKQCYVGLTGKPTRVEGNEHAVELHKFSYSILFNM